MPIIKIKDGNSIKPYMAEDVDAFHLYCGDEDYELFTARLTIDGEKSYVCFGVIREFADDGSFVTYACDTLPTDKSRPYCTAFVTALYTNYVNMMNKKNNGKNMPNKRPMQVLNGILDYDYFLRPLNPSKLVCGLDDDHGVITLISAEEFKTMFFDKSKETMKGQKIQLTELRSKVGELGIQLAQKDALIDELRADNEALRKVLFELQKNITDVLNMTYSGGTQKR